MKPVYLLLVGAFCTSWAVGAEPELSPPQMTPAHEIALPNEEGLKFTLKEAEAYAVKNHPHILSAQLTAEAVRQTIREARSGFFPQVYLESDSVYAPEGVRLAALNGINNPSIFSRQSDGAMASQLITDFGRTFDLTQRARFESDAASARTNVARAAIILAVDHAFFDVRRALAVLDVARDTVKARKFSSDQIDVLLKNKLKSSLDARFAQVDLGQAQLLLIQAQNDYQAAEATLSTAMGFNGIMHFSLVPEPLDLNELGSPDQLLFQAIDQRPELAALRAEEKAAKSMAAAERAAQYPKITALGYAGINPIYDDKGLDHNYYAGGINIEVPLATGGKLDARAREATLLDQAAGEDVVELQNTLARDVRIALLNIDTARKKMEVTTDMVASSADALKLAQARYQLGTSSIVELTEAELNDTEAKLQATSARYDYQIGQSLLKFTIGSDR